MNEKASPSEISELRGFLERWCADGFASPLPPEFRHQVGLIEELLGSDLCSRLGVYRLPEGFLLSVVIPVYNEVSTIDDVIRRVRGSGMPCEIILVDDGSTDGTRELLDKRRDEPDLVVVFHAKNAGKGAALRTGFTRARGDVVIIQDADLEYDPRDFARLIQPIVAGEADVVYGSRFMGDNQHMLGFWHHAGNRLLTIISNVFTGLSLSDMETCYKVFRRSIIRQIAPTLREERFGIEPELTARLARLPNVRIVERPISYSSRTYSQGKKIGWRDAVRTLWCILRY